MNCEQCSAEIRHRTVTLDLGVRGKKHVFCSDGCKQNWTESRLRSWAQVLNSIYVRGRGLSRDLARIALHTQDQ